MRINHERGEAKITIIAIVMGIAILCSISSIVSSWMHDEMLERSEKGEEWIRQQGRRPKRKPDTERPIRGQTITF